MCSIRFSGRGSLHKSTNCPFNASACHAEIQTLTVTAVCTSACSRSVKSKRAAAVLMKGRVFITETGSVYLQHHEELLLCCIHELQHLITVIKDTLHKHRKVDDGGGGV